MSRFQPLLYVIVRRTGTDSDTLVILYNTILMFFKQSDVLGPLQVRCDACGIIRRILCLKLIQTTRLKSN